MKKTLFILYFLLNSLLTKAITYYSRQSGSWFDSSTWSTVSCGGAAATSVPSISDDVIICITDTVTFSSAINFSTLTVQNGAVLKNTGGSISAGTLTVNNGGIYEHATDGGTVPAATWGATSECRVTGVSNTAIANGLNQNFGNFTWNCPTQTINQNLASFTVSISGNFNLISTGTGAFNLGASNFTVSGATTINGNLIDNNDAGSDVFNGNITISTNGTWNTIAVISDGIKMRIAGNITHNNSAANSFQAGVIRFVTGGNINGGAGAAKYIIQTLEVTNSGIRTNNHQIEVVNMTLIAPNGMLTQGANSVLQIKDNSTFSTGIAGQTDFTTNTNTVEYIGGSGDVIADDYHHLTINTTDTKNLTGNIIVSGNLNIIDGVLDADIHTINFLRDFIVSSSGTFTSGTSTVRAQSGNSQNIALETSNGNFHNFELAKSSISPVIFTTNTEIRNNLTFPNNGVLRVSNGTTLTVGNSTTLTGAGTKILEIEGNATFVGNAPDYSAGTLRYTGAGTKTITDEWQNVALAGIVEINKVGGVLVLNGNKQTDGGLQLTNGRLQLGNFNLTYSGTEANLTRTSGWIETNGTGAFVRTGTPTTANNFYVGDATAMRNVVLSSFANPTDVRFTSTIAPTVTNPNLAAGMWIMNGTGTGTITLQNVGTGPIAASKIHRSNAGGAWASLPTNPPTLPNFVTTNPITLATDQRFTVFTESSTDFYTIGNATWNVSGNWSNTDGGPNCGCNPEGVAGANVTIKAGDIVTVTDSTHIAVSNTITVEGTLTLNNGNANPIATLTTAAGSTINILAGNFKLANPTSTTINGTINRETTGAFPNGLTFANGSVYRHNMTGNPAIPTATWQPNSTCSVEGSGNFIPTGSFIQNFGNVVIDRNMDTNHTFFNAGNATVNIAGNLTIISTGAAGFSVRNSGAGTGTLNVGGDIIQQGGNFSICVNAGTAIVNLTGNFNRTGGTFTLVSSTTSNCEFNINGNFTAGGSIAMNNLTTSTTSNVILRFNSLTDQSVSAITFTNTGAGNVNFEMIVAKGAGSSLNVLGNISVPSVPAPVSSTLNITSGAFNLTGGHTITIGAVQGTGILQGTVGSPTINIIQANSNFTGILNMSNTSTIAYNSNSTQNIFAPSSGAYGNLTLTNSGAKNLLGNISILGNWTNNATGTFNAGTHTVDFIGTSPQNIGGSAITEFWEVFIDNTNNVSLTNSTIMARLGLTPGSYLVLGAHNLTMVGVGTGLGDIFAHPNGYVVTNSTGRVRFRNTSGITLDDRFIFAPVGRAFPNKYAAILLPFDNFADGQEIAVRALQQGAAPAPAITSSNYVDAVWEVIVPAGVQSNTTSDAEMYHNGTASLVGSLGTLGKVHYHNGSNWVQENTTLSSNSDTRFQQSAYTNTTRYFSVFTGPSTDFYTLANGATWNVNSNLWSNNGTTACNCSPNGVANANVRIRHNASIPVSASVGAGTIINIGNPVTLVTDQAFTADSLAGVSGARLAVTFNGLPAITNNTFATTAGTIVEFRGGAGSIPANFSGNPYINLEISNPGTKTLSAATIVFETLTINNSTLDISTNLSVSGTTTLNNASILDTGAGGTNKFTGAITIGAGSSFLANPSANGSKFLFGNDITNNGTFNLNCDCQYDFNKTTPPLTITPNQTMIFGSAGGGNGNFLSNTVIANGQNVIFNVTNASQLLIANDVTVTNNNTTGVQINGNGTLNGATATSTWLQGANAILAYASDQVPMSTGVLDAATNPNTVLYNRVGDQQLKATAYRTLSLLNNSVKNIPANTGDLSVQNDFIVPASITFRVNNGNFTASSNLTINGTWEDNTTGGINTFNGSVFVGNNGIMQVNGTNTSFFIFNGNISNQGIFNLQDSSQWRLNANLTIQNQSTNPMNFAQPNSGTGQVNGNVTVLDGIGNVFFYTNVGAPISGGGSITNQLGDNASPTGRRLILEVCQVPVTNAAGAVIEYRGNADIPIKTLTANNNLFIYANSIPSIVASTFHHLLFTNSSISSLGGNIAVNGNLTINTGSTLNAVNHNINLRGNWIGNGTFNAGTGNVIFDGTALQTITTNSSAFNNITINNPAHVQLNNSVESASVTFTQGRLQVGNFDLLLTANPATNQITQTFTNASTSYVETNGTGGLVRNNLQIGIEYVFPVGSATSIRHLSINPNGGTSAKAIFGTLSPPAPTGSTDIAAGRWLLSGGNGILTFFNTGCNTNNARVHRLNAGVWDATGITTTASTPIYTTNSQNFSTGEIYTLFAPVNLTVLPPSPTLPSTEVGNNYSFTFSATGGTAPYTFSVSAGTLPTGLSLNPSTDELSGIPTQAGTFSFTITATDSSSNTGSQGYTLLVNKASQTIVASSLTYVALGNNRFDVSVTTSKGLPAKLFSTNNNVAQIENDTILVIRQNFGEADIMAFHPGDANYNPSDTVRVMRIVNFEFVTAVNANLESKIKLFPNPTNGKIWIDIANFGVEKLEIYNTLGQKQNIVWSNTNNHIEIVTDTLSRGVYVLHLHTKQGSVTKRFSKL